MVSSAALEKSETLQSRIERLPQGGFEVGTKLDACPEEWTLLRFRDVYRLRLNTDSPVHIWADGQTLLSEITENLYTSNAKWQTAFKHSEWKRIVFHCFADVVAETDDITTMPSDEFYRTLRCRIKAEAEALANLRTHLFGCHLSMLPDFPALSIGPVTFKKRLDWVARAQEDGRLDPSDAAALSDHWQNGQSGGSSPTQSAQGIIEAVGEAAFVCSVDINRPMGQEAGHNAALMAARLALTAISLGFCTPSKALREMFLTWDGDFYKQASVTYRSQTMDCHPWTTAKYYPGGISSRVSLCDWSRLRTSHAQVFEAAGDAIDWFVQGNDNATTQYPKMAATLYQALLWFHEGCRQEFDLMGLANFMSSLDALAKGGKESGIQNLVKACLPGYDETLKKKIKKLYKYGRSQFYHGTSENLSYDWKQNRWIAEQLAKHCLLDCLEVFASYTGNDNPKFFITSPRAEPDGQPS